VQAPDSPQIRSHVLRDRPELLFGQRQPGAKGIPPFPGGEGLGHRAVGSVEDAPGPDLPDAQGDGPQGLLGRSRDEHGLGDIEVEVLRRRTAGGDGVRVGGQGGVGKGLAAPEVRDLHGDVGRRREELVQQDLGVLAAVGLIRPDMDDDRQPAPVGRLEHPADLLHVLGVLQVHHGHAEVQLQAPEPGVARAAVELGERVVRERIEAAERDEAIREPRRLLCGPFVLRPHFRVGIRDRRILRRVEPVGVGQHHRAADAGGVQERHEFLAVFRLLDEGAGEGGGLGRDPPDAVGPLVQLDEEVPEVFGGRPFAPREIAGDMARGALDPVDHGRKAVRAEEAGAQIGGDLVPPADPAGILGAEDHAVLGIEIGEAGLVVPMGLDVAQQASQILRQLDGGQRRTVHQLRAGRAQQVLVVVDPGDDLARRRRGGCGRGGGCGGRGGGDGAFSRSAVAKHRSLSATRRQKGNKKDVPQAGKALGHGEKIIKLIEQIRQFLSIFAGL